MFDASDHRRSAEAEIMDWADDVVYAVHDLEDFFRAGLIPMDRLSPGSGEFNEFLDFATPRIQNNLSVTRAGLEQLFERVTSLYLQSPYDGRKILRAGLRRLTSSLINQYVGEPSGISIAENDQGSRIRVDSGLRAEVELLKQLTWRYVISNPALATAQFGQRRIIRDLFGIFIEAAHNPQDREIFAVSFQELLADSDTALHPRIVADYIASMTERQAHETYLHLTGVTIGSVRERFDA